MANSTNFADKIGWVLVKHINMLAHLPPSPRFQEKKKTLKPKKEGRQEKKSFWAISIKELKIPEFKSWRCFRTCFSFFKVIMKKANSVLVINSTYPIAKLPVDSVLPVLPVLLVVPVFPPVPLSWPGCLGFPSCPSCPSCAGSPSCPGCPSWTGCPGYPGCPGCPGCPRIIYPVKDSLVRNYILSWWQSRAELYTLFRTVWRGIIYLVYQSRAELYTLFTTVSRGII